MHQVHVDVAGGFVEQRVLVGLDDARGFLQGLVSNDVARVAPGRPIYAWLLTPQGKILFDFFVVASPERHVLFGYSPKHDAAAVDKLLAGFTGKLVADAHSVFNHLYETGDVIECGCWAHARRYLFKALSSDAVRADHALELIRRLFALERAWATAPPEERLSRRNEQAKPLVDEFFAWCDAEALKVLDETPISKAIQYARNQREALQQFLTDGRVPIDNNISERALRRQAVGRKNWLFVGSDDSAQSAAAFFSLIASCKLHGLEPEAYLRDVLRVLPHWPSDRYLELAPLNFAATRARLDATQLAAELGLLTVPVAA